MQIVWQAIEKPYDDDYDGSDPPQMATTTDLFYVVEGLSPSTKYRFNVSATNVKYPGPGPVEYIEDYTVPSQSKIIG